MGGCRLSLAAPNTRDRSLRDVSAIQRAGSGQSAGDALADVIYEVR
jgi:hypothetical protein